MSTVLILVGVLVLGLAAYLALKPKHYRIDPSKLLPAYDYIICGAGSTGSVVATRLSEDPNVKVLLVEAGPVDSVKEIYIPAAVATLQRTKIDWQLQTTPQPETANRVHNWPCGKVLGGSSCLNYMLYVRGNKGDYDRMEREGCTGWGYKDILPLFKKSEDNLNLEDKFHSKGGPLHVSYVQQAHPCTNMFVKACEQSGYPVTSDYNGETQLGACIAQMTIKRGERHSTARAFLDEARNRPNLHVVTDAHVTKVLFDKSNTRATGVNILIGKAEKTVSARQEVIVSCGTVNSAKLLQISGVGPAKHLQSIGVPVVADLPVGHNLQDHIFPSLASETVMPISMTEATVSTVKNIANYLLFKSGPLTTNGLEAMMFVNTGLNKDLEPEVPDLQFHFLNAIADKQLWANLGMEVPLNFPTFGLTILPGLLHPKSKGTVMAKSADPLAPPVIDPKYLSNPLDTETLVEGMRIARKIFDQPAMKEHMKGELYYPQDNKLDVKSDEYLRENVKQSVVTIYHPVGTCKMGDPNASDTVVDPRLKVKGISGLRVADASILPFSPSGNTNAPCIMVGEKAAIMILEDLRKSKK